MTSRSRRPTPASSSRRRIGPPGGPVSTSTDAEPRCSSVASPCPTSRNETTSSCGARRGALPGCAAAKPSTATASATAAAAIETRRGRRRPRSCQAAPAADRREDRHGERGVRGGEPDRAAEAHRHGGERRRGGRMRDPLEIAEQRRAEQVQRRREPGRELGERDRDHPEPHDRRDDRGREQVGRQRRERDLLEVQRQQRRGGSGGRDRDRRHLRHGTGDAPACQRAAQPGRERQQPRDGRERQLPARLGDGERVQRERDGGREPERVPARGRAPGQRGDQPRDPHHAGALDRRAAACQRHVDGDQHDRRREPRAQRQPRDGAERQHERAEQQHVLAADREQVREARSLELFLRRRSDRLVLAEHHAAQQRRLRRAEPGAEPARRALAGRVERPGEPSTCAAGGGPRRDLDRGMGAAPALVVLEPRERRDRPPQAQLAADARAARRARVLGPRDRDLPRQAGTAVEEPHARDRGAAAPRPHGLEQDRPGVDPVPGQCRQPARAERGDARLGQRRAGEHRDGGGERERHAPGERRRQGRRHERQRRRDRPEQQAGDEAEQHEMARMAADHLEPGRRPPQRVSSSRSDASRTSPIPGISPSSSIDPKPPRSSRKSRIFCAVSGPIPLSVSSCSSVAVLRLSGWPGAGSGAVRRGRGASLRPPAAPARARAPGGRPRASPPG